MKERILQIMEHEQLGQAQFAAAIGIQRAGVSHILSGRNKPSLEVVQKILTRFPKLNPDWLLTGQGEMLRAEASSAQASLFPSEAPLPEIKITPKEPEENSTKPEEKQPYPEADIAVKTEAEGKRVERIMVFYSDNTFEIFVPEKAGGE